MGRRERELKKKEGEGGGKRGKGRELKRTTIEQDSCKEESCLSSPESSGESMLSSSSGLSSPPGFDSASSWLFDSRVCCRHQLPVTVHTGQASAV